MASIVILAAGYGKRISEITKNKPKSLIEINNIDMLSRIIAHANQNNNITNIIISTYYLKEQIIEHVYKYNKNNNTKVQIIEEKQLLNTGGGIKNTLPLIKEDVFYVMNSDTVIIANNLLTQISQHWTNKMTALLLLVPTEKAQGYDGQGDYCLIQNNQITHINNKNNSQNYVYAGVMMLHRKIFANYNEQIFPLSKLLDRYINHGKVYGITLQYPWFHVGTLAALNHANKMIKKIE